jgi:hypothetical protein
MMGFSENVDPSITERPTPRRKSGSAALFPPILLMGLALTFLLIRTSLNDWAGLSSLRLSLPSLAFNKTTVPAAPAKPKAKIEPKKPQAVPAPKLAAAVAPVKKAEPKKADPVDEIAQEAARKSQEKAELERLKEKAQDSVAEAEKNAPVRRHQGIDPRARQQRFADLMARHQANVDRMNQEMAQFRADHERQFEAMVKQHRRLQEEGFNFPFGPPHDFFRRMPMPEMRRRVPMPPMPGIVGEELPGGVTIEIREENDPPAPAARGGQATRRSKTVIIRRSGSWSF